LLALGCVGVGLAFAGGKGGAAFRFGGTGGAAPGATLWPPAGVLGGSGGGGAAPISESRLEGGGGTGPLLGGGGGGAEDFRSPAKGGGTRKAGPVTSSSSIGVFGGRGGGGGPGFIAPDEALARPGRGGPSEPANLPASASGGGARNLRGGAKEGEGDRDGESSLGGCGGDGGRPPTGRRDGGGAGGGPLRLDDVAPVSWGLSLGGAVDGGAGGGGGAALFLAGVASDAPVTSSAACFCSTYALIKSAFCSIWSFVMPISNSSSSMPFHAGSAGSMPELLGRLAGPS
jgi:hypothetical protein